jgi:hypothetical protein
VAIDVLFLGANSVARYDQTIMVDKFQTSGPSLRHGRNVILCIYIFKIKSELSLNSWLVHSFFIHSNHGVYSTLRRPSDADTQSTDR